jgi:hypothetical protein
MANVNDINKITGVFKDIVADLRDFTDREVIRYVLTLRNILISEPPDGTPIDTGWASNNWWFDQGQPANSSSSNTGDPEIAGMRVEQDTVTISNIKVNGQDLHITNNVPYLGILNSGSSKQTPAGFAERAILTAGIRVRFNSGT